MNHQSQPSSPRLQTVVERLTAGDARAVEQFWQEMSFAGTPLVEEIPDDPASALVTFLWRGDPGIHNVLAISALSSVDPKQDALALLPGTDVWHKTYRAPIGLRSFYQLSPNDPMLDNGPPPEDYQPSKLWKADPLNRYPTWMPLGNMSQSQDPDQEVAPASSFALAGAPPPYWTIADAAVPQGQLTLHRFTSAALGNERRIWVYLPSSFRAGSGPSALLVALDGRACLRAVPLPTILDNLQARGRAIPIVALFVDSLNRADREKEMACYQPFVDFLADELLPWAAEQFGATQDPRRAIVGGASFGGLAAACAALQRPDRFGNVLSQSGFFAWKPDGDAEWNWLTRQYAARPRQDIRFALDVGLLEDQDFPDGEPSTLASNRQFVEVLRQQGYHFDYLEYCGGHDYVCWRETIGDHLLALLAES
jgi:enterochelin esterase-like enzyme